MSTKSQYTVCRSLALITDCRWPPLTWWYTKLHCICIWKYATYRATSSKNKIFPHTLYDSATNHHTSHTKSVNKPFTNNKLEHDHFNTRKHRQTTHYLNHVMVPLITPDVVVDEVLVASHWNHHETLQHPQVIIVHSAGMTYHFYLNILRVKTIPPWINMTHVKILKSPIFII
jgi:hypothetical protein